MKTIKFLISIAIILIPTLCIGQAKENIVKFFPFADSVCDFPSLDVELSIICQKKISKNEVDKWLWDSLKVAPSPHWPETIYVSLIGYKGKNKVIISAVTPRAIANPTREISRIVQFDGPMPKLGKISDWGYVFDRNKDGRIDYLALVGGAAAFKDENIPEDFPIRGQKLNEFELEYFVNRCKLIFNHWADDNYDGKLDAAVHVDSDNLRDWVERRIVIRSTKFDGKLDDVWAFRRKISSKKENVDRSPTSVPYRPLGRPPSSITQDTFREKSVILQLLNYVAKECKIGKNILSDK